MRTASEELKLLKRVSTGKATFSEVEEIYREHSGDNDAEGLTLRFEMAAKAAEFGYFKWPIKIRDYIKGKRVLDVGCGAGTDSIGFIALGAHGYVGIDPTMKLDSDSVKNKNGVRLKGGNVPRETFGWTPNDISDTFPQISFFRGTFEELRAQRNFKKFDVISLYTVTEHLIQIEEVFEGCARLLASGGHFIYYHHNFYGWNGHHMPPKRVQDIDENDLEQRKYLDWNHILFDPPEGHYFRYGLNRIRLDELKALTEKYFTIKEWHDVKDDNGRLTDEIRRRLPGYSDRELLTSKAFCIATSKSV